MSYCHVCGSKKFGEETGEYDVQTGEKEKRYVCSENPCGHSGHVFADLGRTGTIWPKWRTGCRRSGCNFEATKNLLTIEMINP